MLGEARRRLPEARRKLAECLPDMPAAGGGGGSGTSDRTGRIAVAVMEAGSDQAWTDWHALDRIELAIIARCRTNQSISRPLSQLLDIVDRWAPTQKRRQALDTGLRAAAEGKGDDGCHSCARVKDSRGLPLYSDQHPGLVICKSCYDMLRRVRAHDRYVDAELVPVVVIEWQQRHAGKNVSPTILERLLTSGVT
jgi:hypothetical protein